MHSLWFVLLCAALACFAYSEPQSTHTEEERMVLLHGVLERLDPTLVTEKPRAYQDKNPHGEIVTYRYQYRDEQPGKYVVVEISAKSGALREIHNGSASESLSIPKQAANVGTLRKAMDWLRWVDPRYTVDVEPYPAG